MLRNVEVAERSAVVEAEIRRYLDSLPEATTPLPVPQLARAEASLPAIFSPVAAFQCAEGIQVLFRTGEYDFDDARLLAVTARYKALVCPVCRVVFLNRPEVGEAVAWLCQPTRAAGLVAAVYQAGLAPSLDAAGVAQAMVSAVGRLYGVQLARMGDGLKQMDEVLSAELLPSWNLTAEGRGLRRPVALALNWILRRALDEVLPAEVDFPGEPRLSQRMRVWKQGSLWYQFQSLEYVEDMFVRRRAGLLEAYQGLYALNRNPEAPVDRVRLRVLTAPVDPQAPERIPFAAGGPGQSSLKGEFLFSRRTLLEQHGVAVPDLSWGVAECPGCRHRSNFRQEQEPLTLYWVSQTMDRIKQMLVSGKSRATFKCPYCQQPLGFEHLVLAAYAHYLADQERDLHLLYERRPGRKRTFIQLLSRGECRSHALPVTEQTVAEVVGRPLALVEFWRGLLRETNHTPQWRRFEPGLIGLALPPLPPMKQQAHLARFQDQLVQKAPSFRPVLLDPRKVPEEKIRSPYYFPNWLMDQSVKVSPEVGYLLAAFVEMDRIEELFQRSARRVGLMVQRALDGTLEVRGRNLTFAVDLYRPVEAAILRGLFPGVLAVREAGRQAKRLAAAERTLVALQKYLGGGYSVQYNPVLAEVTVSGPDGRSLGIGLDTFLREWAQDEAQARRDIISKLG